MTSIDSQSLSAVTIDGQNVEEITADGEVVWSAGPDTRQIAETGRISLTSTIDQGIQENISFTQSYTNPVVIVFVPTHNGGQSYAPRVKNVDSNGCTIFSEEPDNQGHATETVCYMVVEAGSWVTPEGVQIEAGVHTTNTVRKAREGNTYGDFISFPTSFSSTPVVLSSLNTHNNNAFMVTQINSTDSNSFKLSQERAETNTSEATEDIGWVAIETGSGTLNEYAYETGYANDGGGDGLGDPNATYNNDEPHRINFSSFSTKPDVLVHGQTLNGNDGYWSRGTGWNSNKVEVYAEEDQQNDDERSHTDETFGWLAIEPNATIIAQL